MTPIILFTYQYKDHTSTKLSTGLGNNRLSYVNSGMGRAAIIRAAENKRLKNK